MTAKDLDDAYDAAYQEFKAANEVWHEASKALEAARDVLDKAREARKRAIDAHWAAVDALGEKKRITKVKKEEIIINALSEIKKGVAEANKQCGQNIFGPEAELEAARKKSIDALFEKKEN